MKPLRVHWASSKPNFGDVLSPLVCAQLTDRPILWSPVEQCDLVAIGSLLQRVKEGFWRRRLNIWGSGFIAATKQHPSRHHFHALRGKMSAEVITGLPPHIPLGDPGLLVHLLTNHLPQPQKRYHCTIIPHYKDRDHPMVKQMADSMPHVEVVDVFSPPMEILEKIRASEFVFSSAMHGLIAADGLRIPNAWVKFTDGLRGNDFKFADYYSVFGIQPQALDPSPELLTRTRVLIDSYQRPGLELIQQRLMESFPHGI